MFNLKSTIYQTEWLDLVFANRNKSYGAYELRQNSDKRLMQALFISCFFVVAAFSYPLLSKHFLKEDDSTSSVKPDLKDDEVIHVVNIRPLKQPITESSAAMPISEPLKVKTTRFVKPVVVSTAVVEDPPTMTQLQNSVISNQSSEGATTTSNASTPVSNVSGTGTGPGLTDSGAGDVPVNISVLQKLPEFPGGMDAFMKFLRKNLRYPARAVDEGISGKVFVTFVIEKDGRLTDIKVLKGIGYGCDEEATRVLRKSPAWNPGFQNDRTVRVLYTIPMVFQMGE